MGNSQSSLKPVLYIDVDGVLLRHPDRDQFKSEEELKAWWKLNPGGGAPRGVEKFLTWGIANCECRWLTAWAIGGEIGDVGRSRLARSLKISEDLLRPIYNPLPWWGSNEGAWVESNKTFGINWEEHEAGRRWAWFDDDKMDREVSILKSHGALKNFININTSKDEWALYHGWMRAQRLFARPEEALFR